MDVSSVSSGASAYTSALKQSTQAQQPPAVERREPRPEERNVQTEVPPKPVKNAEGQTTGSTINVTA